MNIDGYVFMPIKNFFLLNVKIKVRNRIYVVSAIGISIFIIGLLLRLYFYLINRSLWIDEAMLAVNIVNRSFLSLLKPLDYNQGAPIGFLLIEKAVISLLGNSEYSLRLIPLMAGLASIPLMYSVSRKYENGLASLISMGLFALSRQLIYYSSEVKQYSSDVLMSLLLLLIIPKCLEDQKKPYALITFGIVGSLAMWISQPTLFVSIGCYLTLGLVFLKRRDLYHLLWLIGICGLWGINFCVNYLISLRYLATNNYLINYWKGSFAPLPSWNNFSWFYNAFTDFFMDPAGLPFTIITGGLLILGIFSFAFRKWQLMLVLTAPFILTLIASGFRKYPFSGRMLLFLVPFLLMLLAEGVERIRLFFIRINKKIAFTVSFFLVVYLFFIPIIIAASNVLTPPIWEDIKPVMSFMSKNYLPGDLIYVYYGAGPAFEFYASQYGFVNNKYIVGLSAGDNPVKYFQDIDKLRGHQRVWFVFSHNCLSCEVNEKQFILDYFNKIGLETSKFIANGAFVYLFNMTLPP